MNILPQNLPFDPTALRGLSEKLLLSHHQNNYCSAIKRLHAIRAQLGSTPYRSMPGFLLNGLKREELMASNSVLLHELYFASLGGHGQSMEPAMDLALTANFGSTERWRDEFTAMGAALEGGSGWVLLTFQPREGTLVNLWSADHSTALAGGMPILALDMYEHAYHMDHGAAVGGYIDAFVDNVHWPRVHERYQRAVYAVSESLGTTQDEVAGSMVLDVRRAAVFNQAATMIPGALWLDPTAVEHWVRELPLDRELIVYCVYGHELSRSIALRLRAAGLKARYLEGGIDGWRSAGRSVAAKLSA